MFQWLKLGCTRLEHHMNKIGIEDSPSCPHCGIPETVDHFLLQCFRFYSMRTEIEKNSREIGVQDFNTNILLGGSNYKKDTKQKIHKYVLKFIKSSNKDL